MSMRRIERLERAAESANLDLQAGLPEGVTVEEAERASWLWARLAADYSVDHGVSIDAAMEATRDATAALLDSGATLEGEFGDDDEEDDDE